MQDKRHVIIAMIINALFILLTCCACGMGWAG
jgi:hypothetical protein